MRKKDSMASKGNQIVIIQKGEGLPEGLRPALQAKGYGTRVAFDDSEAAISIKALNNPVLIAYNDGGEENSKFVASLINNKDLHNSPLIIVAPEADQYESILNRHFVLATTITTPCGAADIVGAVEYVVRYVARIRAKQAPQTTASSKKDEGRIIHDLYKQFPAIPSLVFDRLVKLDILQKDLGGDNYAVTFRPDKLNNKPFLPESSATKKEISSIESQLNVQKKSRLHRIGHLSFIIFNALGFTGGMLERAKTAAYLYSQSFIRTERDLVEKDYLLSDMLRKNLCSRIKDSAIELSSTFDDPEVGKIVLLVAKFIGSEEIPSEANDHLAASAIAAADMLDRAVYQRGVFQPVAAYCLLSKLKSQPLTQLHPLILGCLVKILAEAVTSQAGNLSKTKKLQVMPALMQAAEPIADLVLGSSEKQVPLAALAPGMKLARNVFTYDGRELLGADVALDQDLIWRLWQLAAIRPLSGPLVVNSDS